MTKIPAFALLLLALPLSARTVAADPSLLPAVQFDATSKAAAQEAKRTTDNVSFAFATCAGRHPSRRLYRLRVTINWMDDEIGVDGKVRLDAFDAAAGPASKPIYTIESAGSDGKILDTCLFQLNRGLEEVDWWALHDLQTGRLLFESMTEPLTFHILDAEMFNYADVAGLYVPPDDEKQPALAAPEVVGLLSLSQENKLQSQLLITASDPELARRLRNYSDERRYLNIVDAGTGAVLGPETAERKLTERPLALEVHWAEEKLRLRIPITPQGLVAEQASLPPGLKLAPWQP